MEDLRFPVIKGGLPAPKILSMDDYLKFVTLDLKYIFDFKKDRKHSKMLHAKAQFKI